MARRPKQPVQIAFGYPRRGLSGTFNTFRLGAGWAEKMPPGTLVELVDSRSGKRLLMAEVDTIIVGRLKLCAENYSYCAHNWRDYPGDDRSDQLIASLKKRYPPNRVRDDSVVSVIYMTEKKQNE